MKYFLFKIALFIVVLGISFIYLFHKRPNLYVEKFTLISTTYDIINLGTSHGGGIKYDVVNDSVFKGKGFERLGNTLYYDFQNYKFLKPYLKEGAVVIIPLSYFSFGLDENRTDYDDPSTFVNDFYFYLPSDFIYEYSFRKKTEVYLNRAKLNFNSIINDRFPNSPSPASLLNLHQHVQFAVEKHKKMAVYSDPEKNVTYLTSLIEDIQKSGFKPVLLTTPYYEGYSHGFGKEWLNTYYYNHINQVLNKNDIPYLNYSRDDRFISHPEYFHNSDHFNQNGARYFTRILFDDLNEMGLIETYTVKDQN